jgi:hypothetical protein
MLAASQHLIFQCGSKRIRWQDLHRFYNLLEDSKRDYWGSTISLLPLFNKAIPQNARSILEMKIRWDSLDVKGLLLLELACTMTATDIRDKTYGILGLLRIKDDSVDEPLEADYSLTPSELYHCAYRYARRRKTGFAFHHIHEMRSRLRLKIALKIALGTDFST